MLALWKVFVILKVLGSNPQCSLMCHRTHIAMVRDLFGALCAAVLLALSLSLFGLCAALLKTNSVVRLTLPCCSSRRLLLLYHLLNLSFL